MNIRIRSAFDYDPDEGLLCPKSEAMTKQSFAKECDINYVVGLYVKAGVMPQMQPLLDAYGEAPSMSYHDALNLILAAEDSFATVDPVLRARFGNDPGAFVDFVLDKSNQDELVRLGLSPAPAEPVNPQGSPAPADPAKPA